MNFLFCDFRLIDNTRKELSGLKMLLILSCWIIAGISAEATPTMHYRMKNSSFCLQIGKGPRRSDVMWTFNKTVIVVNKEVTANFTNKVDYNPGNMSLCINKLRETDSGIYKVLIINDGQHSEEIHMLTVQESVPTPVIRMSVMRSNIYADLCNITVNCTVQDGWMLFVCDQNSSCRPSKRSLGKVNITISVVNTSIVCISNNDVSRSNVSESIEALCFSGQPVKPSHVAILVVIVAIIAVGFVLVAIIVCVAKRNISTKCNQFQAQTSLASLVQIQQVETPQSYLPRVSTSSEVSYENVSAMQPSQTSSPTIRPREQLEPKQSQEVDTVYSFLQVPNKAASKEQDKTREAAPSPSVAQNQAEQPAEIDTVYSVLQKPQI